MVRTIRKLHAIRNYNLATAAYGFVHPKLFVQFTVSRHTTVASGPSLYSESVRIPVRLHTKREFAAMVFHRIRVDGVVMRVKRQATGYHLTAAVPIAALRGSSI